MVRDNLTTSCFYNFIFLRKNVKFLQLMQFKCFKIKVVFQYPYNKFILRFYQNQLYRIANKPGIREVK